MKDIETKIIMEATGDLKEEIEEELKIEDPELEEAKAILRPKLEEES